MRSKLWLVFLIQIVLSAPFENDQVNFFRKKKDFFFKKFKKIQKKKNSITLSLVKCLFESYINVL